MVQLHEVPCEECYVYALRGLSIASLVLISRFAPCMSMHTKALRHYLEMVVDQQDIKVKETSR